jgi:tetratricopeptide (TPR) repeat protein
MRKARKAVSVILTLGLIIGLTSWVSAEQSLMEFLFLKNGKKVKCDAVWKGMGDYIWCSRSGNIKGYPNDEVDLVRTFQVQPLFNKKVNQSLASFRQGDWDSVIREASDALILDPENEFAYTNRAAAYIGKGLFRKAIEDCNAAIEANPRYGLAYSNRGFALELLGEPYHAGMDYETGCKLGSELGCDNYTRLVVEKKHFNVQPIVDNLVDRSLEQFRQGDWDGVISTTTNALAFDPDDVVAYTNRSGAYANKGLLKEALDDADMAIKLNPNFALAHNNRGYAMERMGFEGVALEEYRMACKMGSGLACGNQRRLSENK